MKAGGQLLQPFLRNDLFNHGKNDPLFPSDMTFEQITQLRHRFLRDVTPVHDLIDQGPDLYMFQQHPDNFRMIRRSILGIGGKEKLFFLAKMCLAARMPEGGQLITHLFQPVSFMLDTGHLQALGRSKGMVMVMGQGMKRRVPFQFPYLRKVQSNVTVFQAYHT